ncbi:hypothetical protein BOX15_Mlig021480g2 [Macrostomum lignano]|nr:hypothetical protein BOX15_Mlig021480g2 [Macrostomum lignano]
MAKHYLAILICCIMVATSVASVSSLHKEQKQQQQQDFCTSRDDSDCNKVPPKSDVATDRCSEWARAEAASETVPDWLHRLRIRYPCPSDAAAATAAVNDGTWRSDFCCRGAASSSTNAGSWLAAPSWLKSWLCGGPDCGFHIGADFCVRSWPLELPDGTSARQQCCYDDHGQLLTDPTVGAGTSDRRADIFGHWSVDVRPFLACCQLTDGSNKLAMKSPSCAVYYSRRPPNFK